MARHGYVTETARRARTQRRTPTPAEAAMWEIVRAGRLGPRFRRQQPVGPFIADFFCAERGLVVELDGAQHGDDPRKDAVRDRWLAERGYHVLRFPNEAVLGDQQAVRRALMTAVAAPHPPRFARHPLPQGEREG